MRLYKAKVPEIASALIQTLNDDGHIEVENANRTEAEADMVAIMHEYLNRDRLLRESVRERMSRLSIPYDQYSKIRSQIAQDWGHPIGNRVERYLSSQFIESFMISHFIEEVYSADHIMRKSILEVLKTCFGDLHNMFCWQGLPKFWRTALSSHGLQHKSCVDVAEALLWLYF